MFILDSETSESRIRRLLHVAVSTAAEIFRLTGKSVFVFLPITLSLCACEVQARTSSTFRQPAEAFFVSTIRPDPARNRRTMPIGRLARGQRTQRFARGQVSIPVGGAAYPAPQWRVVFNDAQYSGGLLQHAASIAGPALDPEPGYEPKQGGPALNGSEGAIMDTPGARMLADGPISPGLHNRYTFAIVKWPDNGIGYANREYDAYFRNGTNTASDHVGIGHQANVVPFDKPGLYPGSTWRTVNVQPSFRPQVFVSRFDAGVSTFFRNGVNLGSDSGADHSNGMDEVYIGASYGTPPVTEHFKGSYYEVAAWDTAIADDEIAAYMAEVMATYAINPADYYPDDNTTGLTMWLTSAGKYAAGNTLYEGSGLAQWSDLGGANHYVLQGTGGLMPTDGSRINGRPTVALNSSKWMGGFNVQGTLTAASGAAYSVMAVIKPNTITATNATALEQRDPIFADSGDYWSVGLYTESGTNKVSVYHYGGGTYTVNDAIFNTGVPFLLHVWFDGTNLHVRVAEHAAVSIPAANLGPASGFLLGTSWNHAAAFDGSIGDVIFRNNANGATMDADRAYLGRVYAVGY